jgi:tetratricopeptide (TPR) repeat protein
LLNLLAKVPELRVVSRTSAFSFKGKDLTIAELAEQLGVAHILEGSVRKSGDQVRITAQLIDTQTDTQLWSNRWDRELTDVFAIQDEIAQSVVSALRLTLLGETPSVVATDTRAYTLYLQARHLATRGTPQSMLDAIPLYRQSLEIDPQFIPAWLGLGANFSNMASTKDMSPAEAYPEIMTAARRVLEIDATNADGHVLMAWAEDNTAGNYQAALNHYKKALELDPNNTRARGGLALLYRHLGQIDRAILMQESLLEIDPVNASLYFNLGMSYVAADDLARAATAFDNALSINPEGLLPRVWRALIDLLNGSPGSSLEQWEKLSQDTGSELFLYIGEALALPELGDEDGAAVALSRLESGWGKPFAYVIATVHAYHSRRDQAFDWLDRTLEYHGPAGLALARIDPMLRSLHEDPRWQPLLARAGMSDADVAAILAQK